VFVVWSPKCVVKRILGIGTKIQYIKETARNLSLPFHYRMRVQALSAGFPTSVVMSPASFDQCSHATF
jgi:hypothetical protein